MDERTSTNSHDNIDPDSIDTGEPIRELRELSATPPAGLLRGIRRSVNRRTFAASSVEFSFMGVGHVFVSYLTVAMDAVFGKKTKRKKDR